MRRQLTITAIVATLIAGAASAQPAANACPKVSFAAVAAPTDVTARHVPDQAGVVVNLAATDLVSPPEIVSANVNITEGQPVLNLSFQAAAGARVRAFTAQHVGEQIAMLVDGKVVRVVKILDPIQGNGILIGPVDRPAAEVLAAKLNQCAK